MEEYLVVDGYNIIYSWPELNKLKDSSLEHARDKLIHLLSNYAAFSGERIVVVFDAHQVKNNPERSEAAGGIEVVYTQEGETADNVIEKLVGNLLKLGTVYVATSDWVEQRIIFGRGAYRITPRELLAQMEKVNKEGRHRYEKDKPANAYLESRLGEEVRLRLERWRRKKD